MLAANNLLFHPNGQISLASAFSALGVRWLARSISQCGCAGNTAISYEDPRSAPISLEQREQLQMQIWDMIYRNGPTTISQLSDQLHLNPHIVQDLVAHAWFAVRGQEVQIAITGE